MDLVKSVYDMLYLVTCAVQQISPEKSYVQSMDLNQVFYYCKFHSITGIIYDTLERCGIEYPLRDEWRQSWEQAIVKSTQLACEYEQVRQFCEESRIWYMPLKGTILKEFYPDMLLREMSDVDILYNEKYQQEVCDWFVKRGYIVDRVGQGNHDVYLKKPVYNFEMHSQLFEALCSQEWIQYYCSIRERLIPDMDSSYGLHFSDEDFYIYLIAHNYKHYSNYGIGIRSLIDCYMYLEAKEQEMNWKYIVQTLQYLGINQYEAEIRGLGRKIFKDPYRIMNQELNEQEIQFIQPYLLYGVHGTQENYVKNGLNKLASNKDTITIRTKVRYLLSRIFPNKEFMIVWCKEHSPFFRKYIWLYRVASLYRISIMIKHRFKKGIKEVCYIWKNVGS